MRFNLLGSTNPMQISVYKYMYIC